MNSGCLAAFVAVLILGLVLAIINTVFGLGLIPGLP